VFMFIFLHIPLVPVKRQFLHKIFYRNVIVVSNTTQTRYLITGYLRNGRGCMLEVRFSWGTVFDLKARRAGPPTFNLLRISYTLPSAPCGCYPTNSSNSINPTNPTAQLPDLKIFSFKSFIILKCFALEVTKVRLFSIAVAAIIASPARIPLERVYSSM